MFGGLKNTAAAAVVTLHNDMLLPANSTVDRLATLQQLAAVFGGLNNTAAADTIGPREDVIINMGITITPDQVHSIF